MAVFNQILGRRLRAAREKKKYTQENVAEAIDMSAQHISRIECGKKSVYLDKLAAWCDFLDVPIAEIIAGADVTRSGDVRFNEITRGCSPETVERLLGVCSEIVEISKLEQRKEE